MSDDHKQAKSEAAAAKARAKAQRPWYRKKRFLLPLGLLVVVALLVTTMDQDSSDTELVDDTSDSSAQAEEDAGDGEDEDAEVPESAEGDDIDTATIGEPATAGDMQFTVASMECGLDTIGAGPENPFTEEASGQFCVLDLTVENVGDEAVQLSASNQHIYDSDERQFSSEAGYALALDSPLFEQINPGTNFEGQIAFDVPADASISYAEFADSAVFAETVVVGLSDD